MSFQRVVCGVDGSPEALEALRQARALLAPGGRLVAITACEDYLAVHTGPNAPRVAAELRADAARAQAAAEEALAGLEHAEALVVRGRPVEVLRRAIAREDADLVAVGSHGSGRALGLLLGSVATALLREAPCSVLLARRGNAFPRVVVGADGSEAAARAEAVAASLGADVETVAAASGGAAVAALTAASSDACLVVVGSRGRRGIAALGSVGERVAHRARCSVLVVRQAPPSVTKTTKAAYRPVQPTIGTGPNRRRAITK